MTVQTFDTKTQLENIVSVSKEAAEHFKALLQKNGSKAIRISMKESGCTGYKYVIDDVNGAEASDIKNVLDNGVEFFIDSAFLGALKGMQIDLKKQGLNLNLVMENPNVKDECGCGESFSV